MPVINAEAAISDLPEAVSCEKGERGHCRNRRPEGAANVRYARRSLLRAATALSQCLHHDSGTTYKFASARRRCRRRRFQAGRSVPAARSLRVPTRSTLRRAMPERLRPETTDMQPRHVAARSDRRLRRRRGRQRTCPGRSRCRSMPAGRRPIVARRTTQTMLHLPTVRRPWQSRDTSVRASCTADCAGGEAADAEHGAALACRRLRQLALPVEATRGGCQHSAAAHVEPAEKARVIATHAAGRARGGGARHHCICRL